VREGKGSRGSGCAPRAPWCVLAPGAAMCPHAPCAQSGLGACNYKVCTKHAVRVLRVWKKAKYKRQQLRQRETQIRDLLVQSERPCHGKKYDRFQGFSFFYPLCLRTPVLSLPLPTPWPHAPPSSLARSLAALVHRAARCALVVRSGRPPTPPLPPLGRRGHRHVPVVHRQEPSLRHHTHTHTHTHRARHAARG
jgi:hypothetical protein